MLVLLPLSACGPRSPVAPASATEKPDLDDPGPAYFTQATDTGQRYAHNWIGRPCFTIDLPGYDWVLNEATADHVVWRFGDQILKAYLTDNRDSGFAARGMSREEALRAFVGFEVDFVSTKFQGHRIEPPKMENGKYGTMCRWGWAGHGGRRAGVGKGKPLDQRHRLVSLWLDPWVLTFDLGGTDLTGESLDPALLEGVLDSLVFHPKCFEAMRSGETWAQ